ncbi:flagellar M-ring protein FliF [Halopseudomonas xinjiangensis]|uniref:Flagellar M-ring protein n=1 Tax=Halopseudomonas xinjiangensis TaxID=487184 RepID=A0A1H1YPI6_9GAMM|nr:flagellar basal-body MS-ring/collar protein FliF [Halopseudomonas xinjiangensis]SDT23383.1 flagellar M-ring protein FliF [Halopseudomonas xinjiangensis]
MNNSAVLQTIRDKFPASGFKPDPRTVMFGIAMLAAVIAVAIAIYLWREPAGFKPLYGAGESYQAAEVMQVLDAQAIPYRLHPQSGQVLVREDQLAVARMQLSAQGVSVAVPPGYELFDRDEPLGTSQFVQDVRLKRSLEGELARTVMSLKGIEQARVHLAREENRSFVVGRRQPAKASVMLQLAPGTRLAPDQVSAIVNLVANSVPQLSAADVSVVDQHGALLSRGLEAWGGPSRNWQVLDDYQNKTTANIEEVLAPVLGSGNYRISVAADVDFSQREETVQTFGDAPRLRDENLRSESAIDQLALGVPGSLANRPLQKPADGEEGADKENQAATSLREESTRKLDYDQSVMHVKHAPFALRQQSIAVVLNASSAPEGGWSEEARAEIEAMVRSAAGFNAERGDQVTLSILPFSQTASILEEQPWWENAGILSWARLGALALLAILLLLFVVRPAMRAVSRSDQQPADTELPELAAPEVERMTLQQPEERPSLSILSELSPLAEIRLPAPNSGLELQVEHLQMLARNDPERVSEVLKHWIGRNDRDINPA